MADIAVVRKKYEEMLYSLMNDFDGTGYNTNSYKEYFSKMSNVEFINVAKRMVSQDDFIFSLDIDQLETIKAGKDSLNVDKVQKISEKWKIPLQEYLIMPHRNPGGKPVISLTKYPILYLQVRRFFQQMLQHKNSISNSNSKINPITGQVVGEDKTASQTNVQTYALSVMGLDTTIKEFLGPRSDDPVSKQEMLTQIEKTGSVKLNDLHISTGNKQSINTTEAFTKAACINVKFSGSDDDDVELKLLDDGD